MSSRREFIKQAAVAGVTAASTPLSALTAPTALPPGGSIGARRPRGIVQTVQGPLAAGKLGFTLPHEHLFASSAGFWQAWPGAFGGRTAFLSKVVDKLKEARDEGVNTIVDVTPFDIGRDIRFMEAASRRSGMQIVPATGHWLYPSLSTESRSIEELTEFFMMEIERGIEGTDIKAGVIKVATQQQFTPFLTRALQAAARASKATGTPIVAHSHAVAGDGDKQAQIFEGEGLDPTTACISHSDDTDDIQYLSGLARRGYTLGMDHHPLGIQLPAAGAPPPRLPWRKRSECVKTLIDAGFTNRLFISNDWYFGATIAPTGVYDTLERMNPDGMLFVTRKVIPYLKEIGVSEQTIRAITVDNPKRFFGGA